MSTTVHPTHTSVPTTSRATSSHPAPEASYANGHHHHHHHHDAGPGHQSGPTPVAKKGKQKKVADNSEASKLIAAKISQLELDAAGEKDQEAEIGGFSFFLFTYPRNLCQGGGSIPRPCTECVLPRNRCRSTTTPPISCPDLEQDSLFRARFTIQPNLVNTVQETPLTTFVEREVKKANRELNNLTSKMDDLQKIETLQKRVTEHLADMKRLERENLKNKKRGDMLQKEKDHSRTELSKSMTLKEKLEKLCRELQRENNRLKVY
jgi:hypothetical protein